MSVERKRQARVPKPQGQAVRFPGENKADGQGLSNPNQTDTDAPQSLLKSQSFLTMIVGLGASFFLLFRLLSSEEAAVEKNTIEGSSLNQMFEGTGFFEKDSIYAFSTISSTDYQQTIINDDQSGVTVVELTIKEEMFNAQSAFLEAILEKESGDFSALIEQHKVQTKGEKDMIAFNLFLYGYDLRNKGHFTELARLQEFLIQYGYADQAKQLTQGFEVYTPPQPTALPYVEQAPFQKVAQQVQAAEQVAEQVLPQADQLPNPEPGSLTLPQNDYAQAPGYGYIAIPESNARDDERYYGEAQTGVTPLIIVANPTFRIPVSTVPNTNLQSSFAAQGEMASFALEDGFWIELSLFELVQLAANFFSVNTMTVTNSSPDGNGAYNLTLKNSALPFDLQVWANQELSIGTDVPLHMLQQP